MDESVNLGNSYRIEVSGWGFENNFFVEQTDLFWDPSGDKKVSLHHTPAEGGIVFIRLLLQGAMSATLPLAYQVAAVRPMDCNGQSEVYLRQLRPRTKVSQTDELASDPLEDCRSRCEPKETPAQLEQEEILQ